MSVPSTSSEAAVDVTKTVPPQLLKALGKITEVNSLPEITAKIVQVVEDPRATAHDMHEIVRSDPALAAKILKVVNSAFYGLPSQIASLDRAIMMLGLSAVKNIALAASLSRLFRAESVSAQFAARDLWRHCLAVGVCARTIGQCGRFAQTDEAFVAGLVHDLGLIAAQQLFPSKMQEVADICIHNPDGFCAIEERIIGADHQMLGGVLAARWKFPPGLRQAIMFHHDPERADHEFRRIATTIYVADVLCCRGRVGFCLTAQHAEISAGMMQIIGLQDETLTSVSERLPELVADAEYVFSE